MFGNDYLAAGVVVVIVVSVAGASTFLAFLAFFVFLTFLTVFFSTFTSPAGLVVVVSVLTSVFTDSAAKTTAEKEIATRAATIVERTFFIGNTSVNLANLNYR